MYALHQVRAIIHLASSSLRVAALQVLRQKQAFSPARPLIRRLSLGVSACNARALPLSHNASALLESYKEILSIWLLSGFPAWSLGGAFVSLSTVYTTDNSGASLYSGKLPYTYIAQSPLRYK